MQIRDLPTRSALAALTIAFFASGCTTIENTDTASQAKDVTESRLSVYAVLPPGHGVPILEEADQGSPFFAADVEAFSKLAETVTRGEPFEVAAFFRDVSIRQEDPTSIAQGPSISNDAITNAPVVTGHDRQSAMFAIGYAHAQERLWQQDVQRRTYRSSLAELLGRGDDDENIQSDAFWFKHLGYTEADLKLMFDRLSDDHGTWGRQAQSDIQDYTDGMNAYIAETRADQSLLPLEYQIRGAQPEDWRVTDNVALISAVNAFRGLGVRERGNTRLLRQLENRFGKDIGANLFEDLRMRNDPEAPTVIEGRADDVPYGHEFNPTSHVHLDEGSFQEAVTLVEEEVVEASLYSGFPDGAPPLALAMRSNALLVSGQFTENGRPISVQGPQDGFGTPHPENMEIRVISPTVSLHGVMDFRAPYVANGVTTSDFAYSSTAQRSDQFDTFVHQLCSPDGGPVSIDASHYFYRGDCVPFELRTQKRKIAEEANTYTLKNERSTFGRIMGRATVDGQPVALAQKSIYLNNEASDFAVYAQISTNGEVTSADEFVSIMERAQLSSVFYYIDRSQIAAIDTSALPIRRTSGDFPIQASEDWDWASEPINETESKPKLHSKKPSIIDPSSGMIAGWNNSVQHGYSTSDAWWGGFYKGPIHRVTLLSDPIESQIAVDKLNTEDLVRIQTEAGLTDVTSFYIWPLVNDLLASSGDDVSEFETRMQDWVERGAKWPVGVLASDQTDRRTGRTAQLFWKHLYLSVYTDALGEAIMSETGAAELPYNNLPEMSDLYDGVGMWGGLLHKDLRRLLGQAVQNEPSIALCGSGDLSRCRAQIREAIATAETRMRSLGPNSKELDPVISFDASGLAQPPSSIPWQNRSTYQMVVSSE